MTNNENLHNFRCPDELWNRVEEKAKLWELSVSDIVRLGMKHYLGDLNMNEILDNKESAKMIHRVADPEKHK